MESRLNGLNGPSWSRGSRIQPTRRLQVLGVPGCGKSALLATLALRFAERGWPVLAIKGDVLDPNLANESELQEYLGLSTRPSELLRRLAKFEPVLLVLDQLDALAGYLDLRTARLSILLGLVRRLSRQNNIHIVLSSRTFEFEHDVRLKAVSAESLTLELPKWDTVLALLEETRHPRRGLARRRARGDANTAGAEDLSHGERSGQSRGVRQLPGDAGPPMG